MRFDGYRNGVAAATAAQENARLGTAIPAGQN
jgi:hypothetical protein